MKATDSSSRPTALGRAIRRHRGDLNQGVVADRMDVSQATVSNWELGVVELTCEQVALLEAGLGLTRGTLLVEAGYLGESLLGLDAATGWALGMLEGAMTLLTESGGMSRSGGSEPSEESAEEFR